MQLRQTAWQTGIEPPTCRENIAGRRTFLLVARQNRLCDSVRNPSPSFDLKGAPVQTAGEVLPERLILAEKRANESFGGCVFTERGMYQDGEERTEYSAGKQV
jgi:hypothetical protein